jgi:hypothetical protein
MINNQTLIVDSGCMIAKILFDMTDLSFWDLETAPIIPGAIYVIGHDQLRMCVDRIRNMANSGLYTVIIDHSAEGASELEVHLRNLGIEQLMFDKKLLLISGSDMRPEYTNLSVESLLSTVVNCQENLVAQQKTHEIYSKLCKPYKFLFLNGRVRPHRKYLLEKLKRTGALNHALWTALDHGGTPSPAFTFEENGVDIMCSSLSVIQSLPSQYELPQFRDVDVFGERFIKDKLFANIWGDGLVTPEPYIDTYFSLVAETICEESPYSFRTEKIAKPLVIGHPFIVAANCGFYKDLHNLGFQTFGHVIDETFDQIENAQDRVDRIIDIVTDLCRQDLASFLEECYNICKYNQQHLADMSIKVRKEFPDRFAQFIKNINE